MDDNIPNNSLWATIVFLQDGKRLKMGPDHIIFSESWVLSKILSRRRKKMAQSYEIKSPRFFGILMALVSVHHGCKHHPSRFVCSNHTICDKFFLQKNSTACMALTPWPSKNSIRSCLICRDTIGKCAIRKQQLQVGYVLMGKVSFVISAVVRFIAGCNKYRRENGYACSSSYGKL